MSGKTTESDGTQLKRHLGDLVEGLRHWVVATRAHWRMRQELAALEEAGQLDSVLRDLGLGRADIDAIVAADPAAPQRLEAMMERLGVTERIQATNGSTLRDLETTCLRCQATDTCDHWLRDGKTEGNEEFCPNAEIFKKLKAGFPSPPR